MNYLVSDFIIRIKNASLARRREAVLPYSRINKGIGEALLKEKLLESFKEDAVEGKKVLIAVLKYRRRQPVLTNVSIVSKPSLRVYFRKTDMRALEQKRQGIVILSTSKGIMTGKEAEQKGVGGELLFEIW